MSALISLPIILPVVPSMPWYRFTVPLINTPYIFELRWNAREGAWYFSLFEIDESPIAYGIKIVLGIPLGRRVKHDLFRLGAFIAKDLSGQWKDAGYDDFGTRVQLRYYDAYAIVAQAQTNFGSKR